MSSQATEVLCPLRDRSSYGLVLESYGRTVTGLIRNNLTLLVRSNERQSIGGKCRPVQERAMPSYRRTVTATGEP